MVPALREFPLEEEDREETTGVLRDQFTSETEAIRAPKRGILGS